MMKKYFLIKEMAIGELRLKVKCLKGKEEVLDSLENILYIFRKNNLKTLNDNIITQDHRLYSSYSQLVKGILYINSQIISDFPDSLQNINQLDFILEYLIQGIKIGSDDIVKFSNNLKSFSEVSKNFIESVEIYINLDQEIQAINNDTLEEIDEIYTLEEVEAA